MILLYFDGLQEVIIMRESKKKKKKKDGFDDILGLSYDKDMGKYIHVVRHNLFNMLKLLYFCIIFLYIYNRFSFIFFFAFRHFMFYLFFVFF